MKEQLLIEPATTDVEGMGKDEDYSEWRLFHLGLGSSFQFVTVNEGFQNRDFQTIQGNVSVIDPPEVLGKLRKEASAIWNNMLRYHLACLLALYLFCIASFLGFSELALVPDDVFFFGLIVAMSVVIFLHYVAGRYLRMNADAQITALVETYKPISLEDYGVEIGYGRFNLSQKSGWYKTPALYLRRPHRLVDEEVAPDGGDSNDLDGRFPPVYLSRLIPGEIHIDEKEYDPASMKVDAQTWALLQSTHQKMIKWHPDMKTLAILMLLVFYLGCGWLGGNNPCGGFIGVIVGASGFIIAKACEKAVDIRNLRVYCEVTKVVNEALRKNKEHTHLRVEFHTSEVPGREGNHGRRYQFVQLNLASSNELV